MNTTTPEVTDTLPVGSPPRMRLKIPWTALFDLLVVCVLCILSVHIRQGAMRGDLWLDEGDYALASVRGWQANRWDRTDVATEPLRLLRMRHYHPPLVADLIGLTTQQRRDDRSVRLPFLWAGALAVSLVYIGGVLLYTGGLAASRITACAVALVVMVLPPVVRATTHALPWALIILWLTALSVCLMLFTRDRKPVWLCLVAVVLGGLYVTSEYFYVALPVTLVVVGAMLPGILKQPEKRLSLGMACVGAAALFGAIVWLIWPAGILGHSLLSLKHYMDMSHDAWPVVVAGVTYDRAPKWAYAYWYWSEQKPFVVFSAVGLICLVTMAAFRKVGAVHAVLALLCSVVLLAAHRSHIIGPEYLAHALPFCALVGGLFLLTVSRLNRYAGAVVAIAVVVFFMNKYPCDQVFGADARALYPRWSAASEYLASRWRPKDRMLAPQYGGVGRWYTLYAHRLDAKDWQVQALPPRHSANKRIIDDLNRGVYRFVAIGSTFSDYPDVDERVNNIVQKWPVVWRSSEPDNGVSRLVLYERPTSQPPQP